MRPQRHCAALRVAQSTAVVAGALALGALAAACLDPSGKMRCNRQSDCLDGYTCARGACVTDPQWGCLEDAPAVEASLQIRLVIRDRTTEAPLANAAVFVCLRPDFNCDAPAASALSDEAGAVALEITDEHLEVRAPGYRNTIVMNAASLDVTRSGSAPLETQLDLYSTAAFAALAEATSVVPSDAARGHLVVLARDCGYESASGVRVELDDRDATTVRRYLVNDLPSEAATETDALSGTVVFFNALPGLHTARGTLVATEREIASPNAVIARPGWLSHAAILPPAVFPTDALGD